MNKEEGQLKVKYLLLFRRKVWMWTLTSPVLSCLLKFPNLSECVFLLVKVYIISVEEKLNEITQKESTISYQSAIQI